MAIAVTIVRPSRRGILGAGGPAAVANDDTERTARTREVGTAEGARIRIDLRGQRVPLDSSETRRVRRLPGGILTIYAAWA
jgi:hypothetical protein